MTLTLITYSEEETIAFGSRLGVLLCGGAVVLLDGDLGAGKTRFVQGVAKGLGVTGIVTSPTFNLVLEYPLECDKGDKGTDRFVTLSEGSDTQVSSQESATKRIAPLSPLSVVHPSLKPHPKLLRHFDLYRLEQVDQLDDLDYFSLIEECDAVSLVEWGSKFASRLPLDYILVRMMVAGDNPDQRLIELSAEGVLSRNLLEQIAFTEGLQKSG